MVFRHDDSQLVISAVFSKYLSLIDYLYLMLRSD